MRAGEAATRGPPLRGEPAVAFDVLVIGGGLNGLASLYHLLRLGARNLGLAERFRLGHERGSSHGQARITRSTYVSPLYVRLMRVLHAEEWPRLERDAGERLVHPSSGCFFGPPGEMIRTYAAAVREAEARVDWLSPAEGRRRFPQFRFEDTEGVLLDHTAGVIAAARTLSALEKICRRGGVEVMEETPVLGIDPSHHPIEVATSRGTLQAERLIVAAGAWTGALLPFLRPRLKAARQTVAYFQPDGPAGDYRIGRFPVWVYLADGENNVFYGMPEFGREGVKIARHLSRGLDDDPDAAPAEAEPSRVEELRVFWSRQFMASLRGLAGTERCLYTNTETEDFLIGLHPADPRIAIGAGFSGHGFKFGPLTGRLLAELVLHGKTTEPELERARAAFSLSPG